MTLVVDESLLSDMAVLVVQTRYWVPDDEEWHPFDWVFSWGRPGPDWRNPTYAEAMERQRVFDSDPVRYRQVVEVAGSSGPGVGA